MLVALLAFWGSHARAQQSSGASQAGASQNPPPQAQAPPIKVTTGLVHLIVTVTDRKHNFVTDLDRRDFKVLENGAPQDIQFFGRQTDLPLRIALLLDTSNSIRPRLEFEKEAAIDFLDKVIRRDKDLAFLMTFDNEPQVIQDYTSSLSLLTTAIREQRAGGGTALNDAICMASEKLTHPPLPKGPDTDVRRVVVVISDGADNLSERALSDAIDASIRSEAAVFAVSTNTDWLSIDDPNAPKKYHMGRGDKVLREFADQTGGRAYFPYSADDLAQSFMDIGVELRSQYFIAYSPTMPPNGRYRKIEVRTDRKGLAVRTRKGYYAVPLAGATEGR
ncbi:MAG TPA: VWA domain-containing protein [Candidatus Polarisedimenticolia bacterium]|nr:VWA domain-containing protein [Candidatus Polarisedimenticolia bacterium]